MTPPPPVPWHIAEQLAAIVNAVAQAEPGDDIMSIRDMAEAANNEYNDWMKANVNE